MASEVTYTTADKRLIHEVIADRFILPEIDPLLARITELPAAEGYDLLKEWVLPNEIVMGEKPVYSHILAVSTPYIC